MLLCTSTLLLSPIIFDYLKSYIIVVGLLLFAFDSTIAVIYVGVVTCIGWLHD